MIFFNLRVVMHKRGRALMAEKYFRKISVSWVWCRPDNWKWIVRPGITSSAGPEILLDAMKKLMHLHLYRGGMK